MIEKAYIFDSFLYSFLFKLDIIVNWIGKFYIFDSSYYTYIF